MSYPRIPSPDFIVALAVIVLTVLLGYAIITTAARGDSISRVAQKATPLPARCTQYYDVDETAWRECMHVEAK